MPRLWANIPVIDVEMLEGHLGQKHIYLFVSCQPHV